jgi:hypothetical protein
MLLVKVNTLGVSASRVFLSSSLARWTTEPNLSKDPRKLGTYRGCG